MLLRLRFQLAEISIQTKFSLVDLVVKINSFRNPRKKDEESYPELHEIELIKNEIKVRAKVSKESQNLFNPRPDINTKEVANSNKRLKFSNILSREIESIFEEVRF